MHLEGEVGGGLEYDTKQERTLRCQHMYLEEEVGATKVYFGRDWTVTDYMNIIITSYDFL